MQQALKPGFQGDINGMRGLSVLIVVLYHFNLRIVAGGFVGVDVFFVISGFLMTKIIVSGILQQRFSYAEFVLRRATRIFPGLFCVVLALLVLGYFYLPPSDLYSLAQQSLQAVLFNSNNFYAGKQGYFDGGADDNWLLHTWSLAVEWQFYLLYPPLVWGLYALARRIYPARAPLVLGLLLGATAAASLAYCIQDNKVHAFFAVTARSWQMLAGGLVYMALRTRTAPPRWAALGSYAGCALVLLSMLLIKRYSLESAWPGYHAALPVAGACLILLAGYQGNPLLNNVVTQKLGLWSYSIYLWHMPLVILLTVTGLLADHTRPTQIGGVLLSVLLGYLSFRYIEPARYLKHLSVKRSYAALLAAGAGLAAVALAGVQTGGFLHRVDDPAFFLNLKQAQVGPTYDPGCENFGRSLDHFCFINKDAPGRKVLVIGDSHAGHLYSWFTAHSKVNTTFFVKSGCPVIVGFERVGANLDCSGFAARAFALAAADGYDTVIISQHWSNYSPRSQAICAMRGGRCVAVAQLSDPAEVLRSARGSIQQLLDRGVKVSVVDGTPFFPTSAPKKLERDFFWYGTIPAGLEAGGFFEQNREYDQLFGELRAQPRFALLSLRPTLCEGQRCRIFDAASKLPIFRDRDHFNPDWIKLNGEIFRSAVDHTAVLGE